MDVFRCKIRLQLAVPFVEGELFVSEFAGVREDVLGQFALDGVVVVTGGLDYLDEDWVRAM